MSHRARGMLSGHVAEGCHDVITLPPSWHTTGPSITVVPSTDVTITRESPNRSHSTFAFGVLSAVQPFRFSPARHGTNAIEDTICCKIVSCSGVGPSPPTRLDSEKGIPSAETSSWYPPWMIPRSSKDAGGPVSSVGGTGGPPSE